MAGTSFDADSRENFEPEDIEIGSLFLFLACVSIMGLLFGRKSSRIKIFSVNYVRMLVLSLYVSSWLFAVVAAMLAQTNNGNFVSCTIASFCCIFLYGQSKVIVYLFLVERAHIVASIGVTRWNSRLFKFNMALLAPFSAIMALTLLYRKAEIDDNGYCFLGFQSQASIPLVIYDILIHGWLTAVFLKALVSSTSQIRGPNKSKLRTIARRTLIGTIAALISTTTNITVLAFYNGRERGVLCLALCSVDLVLSAITIHWVTSVGEGSSSRSNSKANAAAGDCSSRYAPHSGLIRMDGIRMDGWVPPLVPHQSVCIESYVEEYRQLHIANNTTLDKPF